MRLGAAFRPSELPLEVDGAFKARVHSVVKALVAEALAELAVDAFFVPMVVGAFGLLAPTLSAEAAGFEVAGVEAVPAARAAGVCERQRIHEFDHIVAAVRCDDRGSESLSFLRTLGTGVE